MFLISTTSYKKINKQTKYTNLCFPLVRMVRNMVILGSCLYAVRAIISFAFVLHLAQQLKGSLAARSGYRQRNTWNVKTLPEQRLQGSRGGFVFARPLHVNTKSSVASRCRARVLGLTDGWSQFDEAVRPIPNRCPNYIEIMSSSSASNRLAVKFSL